MAANIRSPHRETIYTEYNRATRLDPYHPEDETPKFLKGNIIIPSGTTATIKTVGTRGTELLVVQHIMDLESGKATNPSTGATFHELKENDLRRAEKFFARLAAYTNAFAARMPN